MRCKDIICTHLWGWGKRWRGVVCFKNCEINYCHARINTPLGCSISRYSFDSHPPLCVPFLRWPNLAVGLAVHHWLLINPGPDVKLFCPWTRWSKWCNLVQIQSEDIMIILLALNVNGGMAWVFVFHSDWIGSFPPYVASTSDSDLTAAPAGPGCLCLRQRREEIPGLDLWSRLREFGPQRSWVCCLANITRTQEDLGTNRDEHHMGWITTH